MRSLPGAPRPSLLPLVLTQDRAPLATAGPHHAVLDPRRGEDGGFPRLIAKFDSILCLPRKNPRLTGDKS